MGQPIHKKLIILTLFLILTSALIYSKKPSQGITKQRPLAQAMLDIKDWSGYELQPLDDKIIEALDLDDYANLYYSKEAKKILLYIGYYLTTQKVGASHSPLVCLPGHGWNISNKSKKRIKIKEENLYLTSMVISKPQNKGLVLYWFQAFNKTFPDTFFQKIYAMWAKIFYGREDNAFVRIEVLMENQTQEEAFKTGVEFIESFYPVFLKYVKENNCIPLHTQLINFGIE